jgi:hypothetical protein
MISGIVFSHDKHILRALEKNAFLGHSTLASPSTEPNPYRFGLPTGNPHWHHQKEEDPHLYTRGRYKNKT